MFLNYCNAIAHLDYELRNQIKLKRYGAHCKKVVSCKNMSEIFVLNICQQQFYLHEKEDK